jgi:hypothetical protein
MVDEPDLHPDRLTLELSNGVDAGLGHDHVVAVAVVVQEDRYALATGRAGHESIAVGHAHGVDLAGREGFHRGDVVEPRELDVHASLLEPALLDGDLPSDPTGPIAVGDLQTLARPSGGRHRRRRAYGHGIRCRSRRGGFILGDRPLAV